MQGPIDKEKGGGPHDRRLFCGKRMSELDALLDFVVAPEEIPSAASEEVESPAPVDDPGGDGSSAEMKRSKGCQGCGAKKLLISYPEDPESPDGFADICTLCLAEALEDRRQADALTISRGIDGRVASTLKEAIKDIVPGGGDEFSPHVSTIFESIMQSIGGVRVLGQAWVASFQATKPGSKERRGMLNDLIKLGIKNTELGRAKQLSELSTEDLQFELMGLMQEVRARLPAPLEAKSTLIGESRERHPVRA